MYTIYTYGTVPVKAFNLSTDCGYCLSRSPVYSSVASIEYSYSFGLRRTFVKQIGVKSYVIEYGRNVRFLLVSLLLTVLPV